MCMLKELKCSRIFLFLPLRRCGPKDCVIRFVLTGECFVCEQKPNFAFCKNSYRLFACLFSLSIKIFFFVAGLSKAKMS